MKYQYEEVDVSFQKISKMEQVYNFKYALVLFFLILGLLKIQHIQSIEIICPYCDKDFSMESRWFPSVWICSNPYCGYDNYEGIEYCVICGTQRVRRI